MTRVALLGDIGLFGRHTTSNPHWERFFGEVAEHLSTYDLVVGNLETPFSDRERPVGGKSAYLRATPDDVAILQRLHIDALSLANNHMLDFGRGGLERTRRVLDDAGIAYYGLEGRKLDLMAGTRPVRLMGYCSYDTNPQGLISGELDAFSVKKVKSDLDAATLADAYPIISVHFGIEHRSFPLPRHQTAFKSIADGQAFALHGHHPHVFQPVEKVGDAILAYSLGNFCFDDVVDEKTGATFLEMGPLNRMSGIVSLEWPSDGGSPDFTIVPIRDDGDRLRVNDSEAQAYIDYVGEAFERNKHACEVEASAQRAAFTESRRKLRDVSFFIQRMRPRYARMMAANALNKLLDKRHVPF